MNDFQIWGHLLRKIDQVLQYKFLRSTLTFPESDQGKIFAVVRCKMSV